MSEDVFLLSMAAFSLLVAVGFFLAARRWGEDSGYLFAAVFGFLAVIYLIPWWS